MAILNSIRKRTSVLIIVIGLALFSFVISGIFSSNTFQSVDFSNNVAEVNDNPLSIEDFRQSLEIASNAYGQNFSNSQLVNIVFDQEVRKEILKQEHEKLGLNIEGDQIVDFIRTSGYANIPDFQNDEGFFDEYVFKATVASWKSTNPAQYDAWLIDEANIINAAKEQMYFNFVNAGVSTSLQEGESTFKFQNDKVSFDYVQLPYSSIADSLVSVSKEEIADYVSDNAKQFKQEEARDLRYVFFQEKPSKADEDAVLERITSLLEDREEYSEESKGSITVQGFKNTTDEADFIQRFSDVAGNLEYRTSETLPSVAAAQITALAKGAVYGPYKDGNTYKISKLVDSKKNGSVRSSHILVAFKGAERAASTVERSKGEARLRAQEYLRRARSGNEAFADLAREGSDGPTGTQGGDLGFVNEGVMVDAFNDFIFDNRVGRIGLVETEFGFHVVKVEAKRDVYSIATVALRIEPSETTTNTLFTDATTFEMKVSDAEPKSFSTIANEGGYSVRPISQLKVLDENLPGLGAQRNIVRWAFDSDRKVGDISRFDTADGYVIAQMTKKYEEGVQTPEQASARVLPILRKKKKAAMLKDRYGSSDFESLEGQSTANTGSALAMTTRSSVISGIGSEPYIVGKALALDAGQNASFIEGEYGVYALKITEKNEAMSLATYAPFTETIATQRRNRAAANAFFALKEKAEIKDNRSIFY